MAQRTRTSARTTRKAATRPAKRSTRRAAAPARRPQRATATKPTRKATAKPVRRTATKPTRKSAAKPAAKAARRPVRQTAAKAARKPAARTVRKPARKPVARKAAAKAVRKPAARTVRKTAAKAVRKPAARKTAAKPVRQPAARKTAAKPVRQPAARTGSKVAAKTARKPATRAGRKAATRSAAKPVRRPVAKAAPKPAPKARSKTTPARPAPDAPAAAHDAAALQARLAEAGRAAGVPAEALAKAAGGDPFAVLEWLVPRRPTLPAAHVRAVTEAAEAALRDRIMAHPGAGGARVLPVIFGTGGHRGEIGRGLTLLHVYAIVTALLRAIAAMSTAERAEHFGAAELAAVQQRGFVLGHDNRLFNPEFSFYAASLLREAGYAVRYAGRVSSPELSLLVPHEGWAGSLNFTPSHNPFRYGGLKFAPADGGLAGGELTDPLAAEANRLLAAMTPAAWPAPAALEARIAAEAARIERVDVHDTYLDQFNAHPVVRLAELIAQIKALPAGRGVAFVADPVWGAAVPVYQRLQARLGADVLQVLHTEVDPYFGGQTTEPNEQTLGDARARLRPLPAAYKVAIRNDPDSDRGLVGDDGGALKMNRFAALVFRYLRDLGLQGDLVTTQATSHLGPDYARAHGSRVVLTNTGFKNFRPYLKSGEGLVAYEESDGITIRDHTLDKDGVLAGLLALRIVLHYGRPLSALFAELEAEQGHYYYRQETFLIDMTAAEAHQRLRKLGATQVGATLEAAGRTRPIQAIHADDGYKFTLDGGAWVMMRPSGTEPKVRIYAESRESAETTAALCAAAKRMALAAVQGA